LAICRDEQSVACLFNILDLLDQQLDAIKFAADLRLERWRQWTPISGNERVEAFASIAFQRFVSGHTLAEQKALYPVDVPDPLVRQRLPLPHQPATVFLLRRWHSQHRANPRLAAVVGQQRSNQCFPVNPVSLGPPTATRCGNGCRVDDITLDAFAFEDPMYPESIQTSFLD
jgi:hypothetical protein